MIINLVKNLFSLVWTNIQHGLRSTYVINYVIIFIGGKWIGNYIYVETTRTTASTRIGLSGQFHGWTLADTFCSLCNIKEFIRKN